MFSEEDLVNCRAVLKLMEEGDFTMKGKEMPKFLKVHGWLADLHNRMKKEMEGPGVRSLNPGPTETVNKVINRRKKKKKGS
jgi:hypothetical protein